MGDARDDGWITGRRSWGITFLYGFKVIKWVRLTEVEREEESGRE